MVFSTCLREERTIAPLRLVLIRKAWRHVSSAVISAEKWKFEGIERCHDLQWLRQRRLSFNCSSHCSNCRSENIYCYPSPRLERPGRWQGAFSNESMIQTRNQQKYLDAVLGRLGLPTTSLFVLLACVMVNMLPDLHIMSPLCI